jgi:hypothetical protein
MFCSSKGSAVVRTVCVLLAGALFLGLVSSRCYAQQEERWRLLTTPPENVRTVWLLQARHVASELELDRQASRNLMRIYTTAREEHLEKVEALPREAESMRQAWQLRQEASDALEKSLVESLGEAKGKQAAAALGGFNFFFDNMIADILAVQTKALAAVFNYQKASNAVMREARETRSWEGTREKLRAPTFELERQAGQIYSEQQLNEFQEKYGWFFERILSQ